MSLLSLLASGAFDPGDPDPPDPDPTDPELPYTIPGPFPFNVPVYSDLPTPDETGSATHPSAWDFGPGNEWNGYRFWMANTPYYQQDIKVENPCVWGSHNGFDWEVPEGAPNPIYPAPEGDGLHYSDTDLFYDEDADELLLIWRGPGDLIRMVSSSDGVTWPALADATTLIPDGASPSGGGAFIAPSLVRAPSGQWRMYANGGVNTGFSVANSPRGPWSGWTVIDGPHQWHSHVSHDADLGVYILQTGASVWTSLDGINFGHPASLLVNGTWERQNYYRNVIRPYSSTHYSLWYTNSPDTDGLTASYRCAYTRFPKSALPAPGGS